MRLRLRLLLLLRLWGLRVCLRLLLLLLRLLLLLLLRLLSGLLRLRLLAVVLAPLPLVYPLPRRSLRAPRVLLPVLRLSVVGVLSGAPGVILRVHTRAASATGGDRPAHSTHPPATPPPPRTRTRARVRACAHALARALRIARPRTNTW